MIEFGGEQGHPPYCTQMNIKKYLHIGKHSANWIAFTQISPVQLIKLLVLNTVLSYLAWLPELSPLWQECQMGRYRLTEKFLVNCHRWTVTQSVILLVFCQFNSKMTILFSLSYWAWGISPLPHILNKRYINDLRIFALTLRGEVLPTWSFVEILTILNCSW